MAHRKAFPLTQFKAVDGAAPGTFEAVVSVFGNVDLVGDRVVKGAFAKSLQDWKASGDPIPVIWSHDWANPEAHVGAVNPADAVETDQGLLVKGALDVGKPFAAQVYDLLKARRVREFSFAYDVVDEAKASDGANELLELSLIEVGPTLKGANPATQLVGVKSRTKAHVVLDGSLEQQQTALGAAVREWATAYRHDDVYFAGVEATFADHVVAYVESWDEPVGGGTYYRIPYTVGEAGIELGEPEAVQIVGAVQPKAAAAAAAKRGARAVKEGRRNSSADSDRIQQLHDITGELGAACATSSSDDDEPKAAPRTWRAAPTRALLELAELEAAAGL